MEEEKKLTNTSGIPLKHLYTPSDVKDMDYDRELGDSGSSPYTRGIYPQMYRAQPWMVLQLIGFETAERTREWMERLQKFEGYRGYDNFGVSSVNIVPDVPTVSAAIDPDDYLARGLVGRCGTSLATVKDFEYLLHDLPLDKMHTSFILHSGAPAGYGLWVAYAEESGFPVAKLRGDLVCAVTEGYLQGRCEFSPEGALRLRADLIKYSIKHTPFINFDLEGYQIRDAGANAIQELGFCLANSIAVIEECLKRGLTIDDFVSNLTFHMGCHNDFFEEIAKLRAQRRMWTKIVRDRFGAKNPKSCRAKIFVQTSGSTLTWQQPLNNIVRGTLQGLAALLGGVNALSIDCYDEAYSIPSLDAEKQSLRTQAILLHESNIASVVDPLGGSYYVESLTNEVERRAWEYIEAIDNIGWPQAIKSGYIKAEVERAAYEYSKQIWDEERIIVGVNKYKEGREALPAVELGHKYQVNEDEIVERMRKYKQGRDNEKVKRALENLKQVCLDETAEITPKLIDAARAHATLGEMTGVLKEVFGWRVW
jgi:methylmalonyl-CoA mutase N-terminal domain/subunit